MRTLVIDTHFALDLFVFRDARVQALGTLLRQGVARWIRTAAMRDEFERVLAYPQLARWVAKLEGGAVEALDAFDGLTTCVDEAPAATLACGDPDDQKFIDLAVAHRAELLSRDREVLKLRKRLALLGVTVSAEFA